jgi:hypothetical protein
MVAPVKFTLVSAFIACAAMLFGMELRAAGPSEDQTWDYVRVAGVATDQASLDVEVAPFNDCKPSKDTGLPKNCQQLHLVVKDTVVKDRVKQLQRGDRITITFTFGDNNQNLLKQFCLDTSPPVHAITRFWVFLVSGLVCFLICCLWSHLHPLKLILGEDGRYSDSKLQIALWFFVLITTYVATLALRIWYAGCDFIGGVNIPQNLLLISGMSVLTFGGAKAITTSKVNTEKARPNGNQDPKDSAHATPNFFRDLSHSDGNPATPPQLDFGDFQMVIITLIAVATYLVLVFNFLGTIEAARTVALPDVDTTILAVFGLGHGAYLTKKAAGNVGES